MGMNNLENDVTGNQGIVDTLAAGKAQFPPRPVSSVACIFGGFSQWRILVSGRFTGDLQFVNANGSFSVTNGRADQSARYVFATENGHGLFADIFGDGRIVVTLLSQDNRRLEVDFDGLVEQLMNLSLLEKGPF